MDREEEAAEEAERIAQARIETAKAEQDAEEAAEQAAAAFAAMEPPDLPAALTAGMTPMRARLLAYTHWVTSLEAEHIQLNTGRERYLQNLGVPAMTKRADCQGDC